MNTRSSRRARAEVLLVAAAIAAATLIACGGGDEGDGGETPTPRATSPAATATRAAASPTVATAAGTPTEGAPASPTTAAPPPVENTAPPPPVQNTPVPPPPPPPTNTPVPPPPPTGVTVLIKALTTAFSPNSATVPAGATVALTFDNQDAGVMHDFVLYGAGGSVVTSTNVATGPNTQTVTFTLTPGQYAFKCSVHPRDMTGAITAQ